MSGFVDPEAMFESTSEGYAEKTEDGEYIISKESLAIIVSRDGVVQIAMPQDTDGEGVAIMTPAQAIFVQLMSNIAKEPQQLNDLMTQFVETHGLPEEVDELTFQPAPKKGEIN